MWRDVVEEKGRKMGEKWDKITIFTIFPFSPSFRRSKISPHSPLCENQLTALTDGTMGMFALRRHSPPRAAIADAWYQCHPRQHNGRQSHHDKSGSVRLQLSVLRLHYPRTVWDPFEIQWCDRERFLDRRVRRSDGVVRVLCAPYNPTIPVSWSPIIRRLQSTSVGGAQHSRHTEARGR